MPPSAFQTVESYASVKLHEAPSWSPSHTDDETASLLSAMASVKLKSAEASAPPPPEAAENLAAEAVAKLRVASDPRREKARRRGVARQPASIDDTFMEDDVVLAPASAPDASLALEAPPPVAAPPEPTEESSFISTGVWLHSQADAAKELWDAHRQLILRLLLAIACLVALSDALFWIGYQTLEAYHHHYGIFAGVPPPSPFPPPMPPAPPAAPPPPWIPPGSRIERTKIIGHARHVPLPDFRLV